MYTPNSFKETDPDILYSFISEHNFGIVFTETKTGPMATHLPFMVNREEKTLIAHFAKANKQWQHTQTNKELLIVFQGPHGYISPSWYKEKNTVPTWNYAAVHAYGNPVIIHGLDDLRAMVDSLTHHHEESIDSDWDYESAYKKRDRLLKGIVGLKVTITQLEGQFKFNQNRSTEDQNGVIKALESSSSPTDQQIAKIMRKNQKAHPDTEK
jgi:transcriptional regulator